MINNVQMRRPLRKTALASLLFAGALLAAAMIVEAQQPITIPRIGVVSAIGGPNAPDPQIEAFRQGLRELGYLEGKNILVEYRYAEGKTDRLTGLVAELVQLKVDVLVGGNLTTIRAAKQATKTIPIVMVTTGDPVALGFIDSLARPGGNITGLTRLTRDLSAKWLELFKEVVPGITRVGFLVEASSPDSVIGSKEYDAAARLLKIEHQVLEVRAPNADFEGAFQAATKGRVNSVLTLTNAFISRHAKRIADLAIKNRLPSMYERSAYVEAGGLVSYAANDLDLYRRAAVYVDKILKGAKPAELPVEQPTKFELVINLKAAKQIDLRLSPDLLARADKVIK